MHAQQRGRRSAMRLRSSAALALVGLVLGLVGCGGGQAEKPAAEEPAAAAPVTPPAAQPATTGATVAETQAAAGESVTVAVGESAFGPILVVGETGRTLYLLGRTLYLFTDDPPGESACPPGSDADITSPCAGLPPLLTEGPPKAGEGVDASLLGTATRADGSTQVTYGGHPLYTYIGDYPGDTIAHGAEGKWFIVTVGGEPVTVTTEE